MTPPQWMDPPFEWGREGPDGFWYPLDFDWESSSLYTHRDPNPHIFSFLEEGDVASGLTNAVFQ